MSYPVDLRSSRWKAFSASRKKAQFRRCAVCSWDYLKRKGWLEEHHLTYARANRERAQDTVSLCDRHHPKGRYTREQIRMDRQAYLFTKWAWILVSAPFRLLYVVFKHLKHRRER